MPRKKTAGKVTPIKKHQPEGLSMGSEAEAIDALVELKHLRENPLIPPKVTEVPASDMAFAKVPLFPSPLVISLQQQIAKIVEERSGIHACLRSSANNLREAQANYDNWNQHLKQAEDEVQYLMSLIAQAEGRPVMQGYLSQLAGGPGVPTYPADLQRQQFIPGTPQAVQFGQPINPGFAGAGSIPAPQMNISARQIDPNDTVNKSVVSDEERYG